MSWPLLPDKCLDPRCQAECAMTALLRIILAIAGLAIMALGLNVGLGGIATLGWQGPTVFFTITDQDVFAVQDNHIRFIAGVWFGVGLMFVAGAVALDRFRSIPDSAHRNDLHRRTGKTELG